MALPCPALPMLYVLEAATHRECRLLVKYIFSICDECYSSYYFYGYCHADSPVLEAHFLILCCFQVFRLLPDANSELS
jgi:hypothetical protein